MTRRHLITTAAVASPALLAASRLAAQTSSAPVAPEGLQRVELTLDGVSREALVYAPSTAKSKPTPLVFAFHGHGGTARNAVHSFAMNQHWPEAISVYMQGLPTAGRLVDREGKFPGWQGRPGDEGDRDLKFFDAMLTKLKADYQVAPSQIFSTGHSNGGGFTYLLWLTRGETFAALAPSSAAAPGMGAQMKHVKPKPVMHIAGEADKLVKFEWQKELMEAIRQLNECEPEGKPWDQWSTLYPSKTGNRFISVIHPGGHTFPTEVPRLITKFFKEQVALAKV